MKWRAAVKIAYDGRQFMGSQRQPGVPTVEGEVIRALAKIGAIKDPGSSRFSAASRTDRGVSALGNVIAFDTCFRRQELLPALNAVSEKVHFIGLAAVPPGFSPRRALYRWYRYLLPYKKGLDTVQMAEAARLFEGEHDFSGFCRVDGRDTVRTVQSVTVTPRDGVIFIDVKAREFLWNMVRRMVAALELVGEGRADCGAISRALEGERIFTGIAPPENLILMDVRYEFSFRMCCPETLRRKLEESIQRLRVSYEFHHHLKSICHMESGNNTRQIALTYDI